MLLYAISKCEMFEKQNHEWKYKKFIIEFIEWKSVV